MAKESKKAKNRQRLELIQKYYEKREQLKKEGKWFELQKLPRNSMYIRYRQRCSITGRPRGYIRYVGLCRNMFRELAAFGYIPCIRKASW